MASQYLLSSEAGRTKGGGRIGEGVRWFGFRGLSGAGRGMGRDV